MDIEGEAPRLQNCIIAFSTSGVPVSCGHPVTPELACCDLFGNAGGDWVGCIDGQLGESGNISMDPLFCAMEDGDYRLGIDSPCDPENHPECGLIGAWPVGCASPVRVEPVSWGRSRAAIAADWSDDWAVQIAERRIVRSCAS